MKKIIIAMIVIMAIGIGLFFGYNYFNSNKLSYITISINPEILLAVNSEGKVVEVTAVNEDADILVSDLDLIGLTAEEASNLIIDSAYESGYINEYATGNEITITTVNEDEQERLRLEERLMTNLNNHLAEKKVYALLVAKELGEDLKTEAETYGISNGKMLLIEEAVVLNNALDKKELADMTIREIQELIKVEVKERHDALNKSMESLKEEWKTKKTTLKEETRTKLEEIKNSIQNGIENYNSMTEEQKREAFQNAIETKKEEIKTIFDSIKNRIRQSMEVNQNSNNNDTYEQPAETENPDLDDEPGVVDGSDGIEGENQVEPFNPDGGSQNSNQR